MIMEVEEIRLLRNGDIYFTLSCGHTITATTNNPHPHPDDKTD
jgi:hypothetical protein